MWVISDLCVKLENRFLSLNSKCYQYFPQYSLSWSQLNHPTHWSQRLILLSDMLIYNHTKTLQLNRLISSKMS